MVTRLKVERVESGFKQWRLASLVDITPQELSYYEAGRRRCPVELRYKLSKVLEVPVEKLFPENEERINADSYLYPGFKER